MMAGKAPRARGRVAIRCGRTHPGGPLGTTVEPNPALLLPWTSDRGIAAEESSLAAIGKALVERQHRAIGASDFASAYDALVDLTQKDHSLLAGYRTSDVLSRQQHVIVSCPAFDARLSWFWFEGSWRRRGEAMVTCLREASGASDSEVARTVAERLGEPQLAGGMRKQVGAARQMVLQRRQLRALSGYLPEVTVDDVRRVLKIEELGRGNGLVMPILMMCWRGEL